MDNFGSSIDTSTSSSLSVMSRRQGNLIRRLRRAQMIYERFQHQRVEEREEGVPERRGGARRGGGLPTYNPLAWARQYEEEEDDGWDIVGYMIHVGDVIMRSGYLCPVCWLIGGRFSHQHVEDCPALTQLSKFYARNRGVVMLGASTSIIWATIAVVSIAALILQNPFPKWVSNMTSLNVVFSSLMLPKVRTWVIRDWSLNTLGLFNLVSVLWVHNNSPDVFQFRAYFTTAIFAGLFVTRPILLLVVMLIRLFLVTLILVPSRQDFSVACGSLDYILPTVAAVFVFSVLHAETIFKANQSYQATLFRGQVIEVLSCCYDAFGWVDSGGVIRYKEGEDYGRLQALFGRTGILSASLKSLVASDEDLQNLERCLSMKASERNKHRVRFTSPQGQITLDLYATPVSDHSEDRIRLVAFRAVEGPLL